MSLPVAIIIVTVLFASLGLLTFVVVALVRRLKSLAEAVSEVRTTLEPGLADLQRETAAAQEQLARIADEAGEASDPSRGVH